MNINHSLKIVSGISRAAAPQTVQDSILASLVAAVKGKNHLTVRWRLAVIPMLHRLLRRNTATEAHRIFASEVLAMVEANASPMDILVRVSTEGERLATARSLMTPAEVATAPDPAAFVASLPIDVAGDTSTGVSLPSDQFIKLFDDPNLEIKASHTGLLDEAQRLAAARGAPLHTDDVLRAMDARFPYSKPASTNRDLSELRDELAVYMELDEVLAGAEATDPLKIAADHRIRLMKDAPSGPEPLWFRQLRWRCQIDLFFLARAVCGKRFTNIMHRPLVEHLVLKNPKIAIEEQSNTKDRLTMCFRGAFKSTASILDCVQWVIDFPNEMRIVILTSTLKLAKRFVGELKQYFVNPKGTRPTTFQTLFPEFVVLPEEHGLATEFMVKNRRSGLKDPTAWAASIDSDDIGSHCDLLILDDAESDKNSANADTLETLNNKISLARMLVDPGGYRQFIGTPYALNDAYAQIRTTIDGLQVFHKPVMTVKPECAYKDPKELTERDVVLAFPERLSWHVVQAARRENPGVFQSQYMLHPSGENTPTFTMEMLQATTIKSADIPPGQNLVAFQIWDTAYTIGEKSDSSVGVTAHQSSEDGRVYVSDIIHEKFLPRDLAAAIVTNYIQYRPSVVIIEATGGAENLRPTIEILAKQQGFDNLPLYYLPVNLRKGAKAGRVAALEPFLRSGRLLCSDAISCLTELYEQFAFFGTARHDDIPDAIGLLFESGYINQRIVELQGEALVRTRLAQHVMDEHGQWDRYFGTLSEESIIPEAPIEPEWDNPIDDPYAIPGMSR